MMYHNILWKICGLESMKNIKKKTQTNKPKTMMLLLHTILRVSEVL